jgi:hypothetical protein
MTRALVAAGIAASATSPLAPILRTSMAEWPCPECKGCGQVVTPFTVIDDDGKVHVQHIAVVCMGCGGKRVISDER